MFDEGFDIILADSYALATSLNRSRATASPQGAFGVVAATFDSWVDGLWEQYGDGRPMADSALSTVVMSQAVTRFIGEDSPLKKTPHLPIAAARCLTRGSGIRAFEAALADPDRCTVLSDAERELLRLMGECRTLLATVGPNHTGFVERGAAVATLAQLIAEDASGAGGATGDGPMLASGTRVCYVSDAPLPVLQQEFFQQMADVLQLTHVTETGEPFLGETPQVAPLPSEATLSFALPAGPYATPQVINDILQQTAGDGPVVITAKDPLAMYHTLSFVLQTRGLRAAAKGRTPLLRTNFGRLLNVAYAGLTQPDSQELLLMVSDVLRDPLFDVPHRSLQELQTAIRKDRLITRDTVLDRMVQLSPTFALLLHLVTEPSLQTFQQLKDIAQRTFAYEPAQRLQMLNAMDATAGYFANILRCGVSPSEAIPQLMPLFEAVSIPVSIANYSGGLGEQPDVLIVTQQQAAQLEPERCATLIMADLTNTAYPATQRQNAVSTLLANVGVVESEPYLDSQRRVFGKLIALPTAHLVLLRIANDAETKPQYPCALLEEFMDVNGLEKPKVAGSEMAAQEGAAQEGAAHDGFPNNGDFPHLFAAGEDELIADALGCSHDWPTRIDIEMLTLDDLDWMAEQLSRQFAPWDTDKERGVPDDALKESPSQLEAYHECPRKWFIEKWLKAEEPGEEFSHRERGTFIHGCAQTFYREFIRRGYEKVTAANIDVARELMAAVVESERARNRTMPPGGYPSRYVARPGAVDEETSFTAIRRELCDLWLPEERAFLEGTGFKPTLLEYKITDLCAVMSGAYVYGIIDRIDLVDEGNAVIVDYEGAISGQYDTTAADPPGPDMFDGRKIQALLYARAIRETGLTVPADATPAQQARIEAFNRNRRIVGIVYFSYNGRIRDGKLRAAGIAFGAKLPREAMLMKKAGDTTFQLTEANEAALYDAIDQMLANIRAGQLRGDIAPLLAIKADGTPVPFAKERCKYCKDGSCEGKAC